MNGKRWPLGRQAVRMRRQALGVIVRDQYEVLEPYAAEALAVRARLEGEDVAGDERVLLDLAEDRALVDLEPDAVSERVVEALDERYAVLLVEERRLPVGAEELGGLAVQRVRRD